MPTASFDCGCDLFPNGVADQYKVTLAGLSNAGCLQCASLNGDYVLSRNSGAGSCVWDLSLGGTTCSVNKITMIFKTNVTGQVDIEVSSNGSVFQFRQTNVKSGLEDSYSLSVVIGTQCNYSGFTCTVVPLA